MNNLFKKVWVLIFHKMRPLYYPYSAIFKSDNTGTKSNANLLVPSLSTADNDAPFLRAEC